MQPRICIRFFISFKFSYLVECRDTISSENEIMKFNVEILVLKDNNKHENENEHPLKTFLFYYSWCSTRNQPGEVQLELFNEKFNYLKNTNNRVSDLLI